MKTFRTRCPYPFLIVALFLAVVVGCSQGGDLTHPVTLFTPNEVIKARTTTRPSQTTVSPGEEIGLAAVKHWLYLLDSELDADLLQQIAASRYDMVVLDYVPSEIDREDFPMAQVIERLHGASHPKLVLAYIDIAEAESFRTYWNDDWRIGDPDWILGDDPDGWADDFPVAFWHDEWQSIWMGEDGLLRQILDMGYDGVYLDWVAAYEDELVTEAALRAGVDARSEMIAWVGSIGAAIRQVCERCVIVAQNPADLVADEEFRRSIDAVAQEHVWFDGGVDNRPQGDCPLPRTADEIDTRAYRESLSTACRR
ncbi:MAG: endo alpha-1,4 polygalactosaminidase, partial [Anaerolineales bacterium]